MRLFIFAFTGFVLFSCHKERDFANGNNGGNGANSLGELLVKMVQKTGPDSLVTTYSYNGNKKLISLKMVGIDEHGNFVNKEYHYHRDPAGIVTDYSVIDPELFAAGIDSLTTIVHYTYARYSSYISGINPGGFTTLDSSAFIYDNLGKIIGEELYQSPSGSGTDYYLSGTASYSYSAGGNLSQISLNDFDESGAVVFSAANKIDFDTRINPLHSGTEAFALGHPEWISSNNITREQLSDSNGPTDDQTVSITYTYNNDRRPETSVTTVMPGNIIVSTAFYYQ